MSLGLMQQLGKLVYAKHRIKERSIKESKINQIIIVYSHRIYFYLFTFFQIVF